TRWPGRWWDDVPTPGCCTSPATRPVTAPIRPRPPGRPAASSCSSRFHRACYRGPSVPFSTAASAPPRAGRPRRAAEPILMRHDFFATCAKGTEGVLGDELRALGLTGVKGSRGGVHFAGVLEDGLRACLGSRMAMRILLLVGQGEARGADGLHERVA